VYGPPPLDNSSFEDLITQLGGQRPAARLLGVEIHRLQRWKSWRGASQMALKLLWYAGPAGREAANQDLVKELQLVMSERDALVRERKQRLQLTDEARSSLGAKIKALEAENYRLREAFGNDALHRELLEIQTKLARVLSLVGRRNTAEAA